LKSIIISGMPASGKTSVAKSLSERYGLKYFSGGDILKNIAISKGYKPSGDDWWDTNVGMKFLDERKESDQFDKEVDEQLVKSIENGGVVVTSYTAPWLTDKAVRIWLKASVESRADRMASRDKISFEESLKIVNKRDYENIKLYKKMYGFTIGEDLSVFNLVIDTNEIMKKDVIDIVSYTIKYFI